MSNDDRWNDDAMSHDEAYMDDESYNQAAQHHQQGWDPEHHDEAMQQGDDDGAPRESRKERRRRLAMEQQAREEAEALAAAHGQPISEQYADEETAEAGEEPVEAAPGAGKFGFLKKLMKRSPKGEAAQEQGSEDPVEHQPAAITLPMPAVIDPNVLTEYGIDPNTLASMGLDPSTLPQFEPDFLAELGINPNIVIDILQRMAAAENGGVPASGGGGSRKGLGNKLALAKRFAPAAAAVTGLIATGSIWFMAGGEEAKNVPEVKAEQIAGEEAEARTKSEMAKADAEIQPAGDPATPPPAAESEPAAPVAAALPPADSIPTADAAVGEPPKAEPVQIAAAEPPGLPALPGDVPPPGDALKAPPTDALPPPDDAPKPPGDAKDAPPVAGLPALPGMSDAPPLPPGGASVPPPAEPKLPAGDLPAPPTGEKSDIAKDLPPVAGLGAAALAADQLNKAGEAVKDAPPLPPPGVKGLDAPSDLPPLGGVPDAKPKTDLNAPPVADAGAKPPEPPGLPPLGAEPPKAEIAKAEPPKADVAKAEASVAPGDENKKKAVAGLAGLAAGLSIGKAGDAIKKAGETASNVAEKVELPKPKDDPASVKLADEKAPQLPTAPPKDVKPSDLPPSGSLGEPVKAAEPAIAAQETPKAVAGESSAAKAGLTEAKADWPTIPNGKGRLLRSMSSAAADTGRAVASAAAGLGAGMAISNSGRQSSQPVALADPESRTSEIAPITHVVESGENFWTISRDYYGSGRYYKALWAANKKVAAQIDQLHVGDTIRIPAMEYLDKSLIQAPSVARSKRSGGSDTNPPEVARSLDNRAVRTGNTIESTPTEQATPARRSITPKANTQEEQPANGEIISQPTGETAAKSGYQRHRVMPGETIRTIARDRLGDARRDDEIVDLNSDVLKSVRSPLEVGMVLRLPADSKTD